MGPESTKSLRGVPRAEELAEEPAPRATQEIDDGRRGKGDVFGAFQPATGGAFTAPDGGRTIANGVDFLVQVDA